MENRSVYDFCVFLLVILLIQIISYLMTDWFNAVCFLIYPNSKTPLLHIKNNRYLLLFAKYSPRTRGKLRFKMFDFPYWAPPVLPVCCFEVPVQRDAPENLLNSAVMESLIRDSDTSPQNNNVTDFHLWSFPLESSRSANDNFSADCRHHWWFYLWMLSPLWGWFNK